MQKPGLFEEIKKLQKICWNVDEKPPEFVNDPTNWEQIYITRKISIWITYIIKDLPITPDQVMVTWIAMGVFGGFLLSFGYYPLSLFAAFLIYLSWILDNVDGELARYKKMFSDIAELLDKLGHELVFPLVIAGMTVSAYVHDKSPVIVICGLVAASMVSAITMMQNKVKMMLAFRVVEEGRFEGLSKEGDSGTPKSSDGPASFNFKNAASKIFTDEAVLYLGLASIVADKTDWFLMFYGFGIPLMYVPKYLSRQRYFRRCLQDPELLRKTLD